MFLRSNNHQHSSDNQNNEWNTSVSWTSISELTKAIKYNYKETHLWNQTMKTMTKDGIYLPKGEVPRVFMWKTPTTLCNNPWRVFGFLIIFSASGFPVIIKFQPATCNLLDNCPGNLTYLEWGILSFFYEKSLPVSKSQQRLNTGW